MFGRENVLASDWYRERLEAQRASQISFAEREVAALEDFLNRPQGDAAKRRLNLADRKARLVAERDRLREAPLEELSGTLGRQVTWDAR